MLFTLIFFLVFVILLYVFLFRPMRKKQMSEYFMIRSLEEGDIVYTSDGIKAKYIENKKGIVLLECLPNYVKMYFDESAIAKTDKVVNEKEQKRRLRKTKRLI